MPLINVYTSALAPDADALLRRLSSTLARELAKPEAYVMTCIVPQARMTFAGSEAPACYAELKNIGELSQDLTARLSRTLCPRTASTSSSRVSSRTSGASTARPSRKPTRRRGNRAANQRSSCR
jgi:phenylpyruvate tautomerase